MRLQDKVAVITGASRGIGAGIAARFAQEGASVVLAARDMEEMAQRAAAIQEMGGKCLCVKMDVRKSEDIRNLAQATVDAFGKVDILINNAGYPMFGFDIDDPSREAEERYRAIMETNFGGYWYCCRHFVPLLKRQAGGSIVNISSVRGHLGLAKETAYCAAKGAIGMLTKSLAVELAPHNIRVNTISPGAIQVDIGHWVLSLYGEAAHKEYCEKFTDVHLLGMEYNQPMRTIGLPEDIANAALYLASDEARFVTGADLVVDGGLISLLPEHGAQDMDALCQLHEKSKPMKAWLAARE